MDRNRNKKTNKNRHGNRKLQHSRRQCRAKGMNNETIEMLITLKSSNKPTQYNHEEKIMTNIHPISTDFKFDQYQVCKKYWLENLDNFFLKFIFFYSWNYIANLSNTPIFNWLLQISKDVILENSMSWDQTKTKVKINLRQKLIQNKLKQVETDLNIHLQHNPSNSINENATYTEHYIIILFMALAIVIYNALALSHMNFEWQKILLYFDIKDALFVKLFHDFNPTEGQVNSFCLSTYFCFYELFF